MKVYRLRTYQHEDSEDYGVFDTVEEAVEKFKSLNYPDCPLWLHSDEDTPTHKGKDGYVEYYIEEEETIAYCRGCYYAVNDATLCEMHTRANEDGEIFEFDITPDWFCADFKRKA